MLWTVGQLDNDPLGLSLAMFIFERLAPVNLEKYEDLMNNMVRSLLSGGACLPFQKKMFITVNGKILVCERIDQSYVMGNIYENGKIFDPIVIASFYNKIYEKLVKQCKNCYRAEYCKQCFLQIDDFLITNKCPSFTNKEKFSEDLSYYISLLENNSYLFREIINSIIIK